MNKNTEFPVVWQTRDEMDYPTNPLQSLRESYTFSSKDMGAEKFDAWAYGIIVGWNDDALLELSNKHGWSELQVDTLKSLHKEYNKAWALYMNNIKN